MPNSNECEDIYDVVSMHEFDFDRWHFHENTVIKKQLEVKGFTDVSFHTRTRRDGCPVSRMVFATDSDGVFHQFTYSLEP